MYKAPMGVGTPNTKPKELGFWEKVGNFGLDLLGGVATAATGGLAAPVVQPAVNALKATPAAPMMNAIQTGSPQQAPMEGGMDPAQAMLELKRRQAMLDAANGTAALTGPQTMNGLGWNPRMFGSRM